MRDAAKQDRMDDARDKLAELDKLLEELEKGRPEHGRMTERQRQRAEKRRRGEQQMSAVPDMVQRQGGLLDHAQQRSDAERPQDPRRFMRPAFPAPAPTPPAPRPDPQRQAQERESERKVQLALRRALGELMQQHGDLTGEVPPNLGEADQAMRDAAQALGEGNDPAAAAADRRAIEALQKGSRAMSQQMASMFGQGDEDGDQGDEGDQDGDGMGNQPGDQPGNQPGQNGNQWGGRQWGPGRPDRPWYGGRRVDRHADERRDPLGRLLKEGSGGLDESGLTQVPEEMEQARTRAIQEELRRRGADRTRPQPELDYIDRLLREF
jgi:hypothetical protein